MKTGTLSPVSSKATWRETVEVTDAETGDLIDLVTDVDAITVKLREVDSATEVLTASLADGTVTVIGTGVLEFLFTVAQMDGIVPKTYEVGVLIEIDGDTTQLILGYLPVLKGL